MAQNIQLKRSALPGKVPDTGSLNLGEIAINTYDGKVFLKKSGSVESIQELVTTNTTNTGSITLTQTGSFGELVITQDANIQRDLYVSNDIIGNGDIDVLGNITGSNLLIKGTLTAQSYIVSSSVVNMTTQFASGSTIFGNTSDDTHQFTGSVNITGSGYINSNRIITDADTGSFSSGGSSYPASGVDYDTDLVSVSDFNIESPQFLIDYLYEVPVGTEVGLKGFLGNTSGSTLVVPANDYIAFVIDDTEVARITAAGFEGASLPDGLVSGSSQLTSSYDTRYVISGSITQTTWDNIASKPGGIISSSTQLNNASIENLTIQNLTTINETASVIYSSGSNKFGDFGDDIHQFTGSVQISGSVTTIGNINGINLTTFSSSINTTLNSLTESKVTHIVSQSGGLYYIDGVQKPSMSFVPGITYRFDTTIPDDPSHQHPFKFSTTPNGPIQYVDGVTSGSNYIQLEVNYNTPEVLYYYCTLHNGMGNTINVLKIDKLLTSVSSSFDSRYVISGSITQTTWDNIASKPGGIVSGSSQVTASLDTRYALSGSTGASSVLDSRSRYLSQSTAATTWSFTHNIGSDYPMVTVYGSNNEIIQPEYVKSLSSNQTEIGFGTPVSGVVVASLGSLTEVTGKTIRQDFTASVSWSFVHNLGDKYVMIQAFDTSDQMILPAEIKLASTTSSIITFSEPVEGYALATIGGDLPSISASYEGYTLQVQSGLPIWTSIVSASVSNAVSSSYILYSNVANKPTLVSGSSQLTSSYDARYVLSGSITQTTWDNIASKPGGIVSSSTQIKNYGDFATTGSNTFNGTETISGSLKVSGSTYVDYIIFNSSSAATLVDYMLQANTTDRTLDLRMGNNATLQMGMELYNPPIVNKSGALLNDGDLVMFDPTGISQGNRIAVVKAISNGTYQADRLVGILTEDVANNAEGFATWFGYVRNISKSHLVPAGETWAEGDILYPNPTDNGRLTNVFPTAPNLRVTVGTVTAINGVNVTIMVNFHRRTALKRAHDVIDNTTTSSYGDLLMKSGSVWTNKTPIQIGLAITGSNTFTGTQTLSGSIIPATDNTYDLGSPTYQWRDIYVSSGSLYIDGTKVLGSTGNELQITTDVGQSIKILEAGSDSIILQSADGDIQLKTSGGGNLLFDPTTGLIDVRGTFQIQDGYKVTSSGGNTIQFGNDIGITGSINTTGNVNGINISNLQSTFNTFTGSSNTTLSGLNTYTSSVKNAINVIGQGTSSVTTIYGNLVVEGTTITVSASNLAVADNMIYLNDGNAITDPDLGIAGNYNDGTYRHAGLFSDASDGHTWKVYKGYTPEPSQSIDTTHGTFTFADFQAGTLKGAIAATNGVVSGSSQISYVGLSNIPTAIVSGSSQITYSNISSIPSGIVSGSTQISNLGYATTASYQGVGDVFTTVVGSSFSSPRTIGMNNFNTNLAARFQFGDPLNSWQVGFGTRMAMQSYWGIEIYGGRQSGTTLGFNAGGASDVSLLVGGTVAGNTVLAVQAAASQTGNLQEWRNSSSQSIARITATGAISSSNDVTASNFLGAIKATNGVVSGSSQVDVMSTTNIARLATTGSNQFNGNQSITGSLIIGAAASTLPLNVYTSSANVNNVIAEFYNGDYTSGTKNHIRVRNNVSVGSTYSSYFGQGQDGNTYITSNDFTRGGDIVINGNSGKTTIKAGLDVTGSITTTSNITIGASNAGQPAMYITRVGGYPTIKGSTANGGDGQIVIDGVSNSAGVYLNNYVSSSVYLATGGGTTYVGQLTPHSNNSFDLGSSVSAWRNIYTNDLHLSNEGKPEGNDVDGTTGNWTIQEGAEHLYIINNKTGKKFKFSLEEIQ